MFKLGMKADTIQFWLLVLTGLGMLLSFAGWADARYMHADIGQEMHWEIHQVYQKVLTPQERNRIEQERDALDSH